ncbi:MULTISPECIES: hypothetical protein [Thermococcus]|jgi:hypothetical protein|nr:MULTISPECIES: hypothetical protein [Thermococcus]MCA6214590.1 hypothetical protein [Thermococcus bergensis]
MKALEVALALLVWIGFLFFIIMLGKALWRGFLEIMNEICCGGRRDERK